MNSPVLKLPAPGIHEENDCARKIARSIAYMTERLDQPLQVEHLATHAHISPSHYFALFKRHTGYAPIDYFIRLRMEEARHLLAESAMNVKDVAAALGYDDAFYFSRVFKSVNNVTPSEYRARQRMNSQNCAANAPSPRASSKIKNLRTLPAPSP